MNRYMFEYIVDGSYGNERQTKVWSATAADALDAFDMFRADHPHAIISHVWVEWASGVMEASA